MLVYETVVAHEWLGDPQEKLRRLVLQGAIASEARPGQFVYVQVASSYDPLLRRPLSIAGIDREKQQITLLYRIQGRGTELLSKVGIGQELSVMGPLGNGFSLPEKGELLLVAGGIGIFPLYPLALAAREKGLKVRLFWGGENESFLLSAGLGDWENLNIPLELSTMDGSMGKKGLVTELFYAYVQTALGLTEDANDLLGSGLGKYPNTPNTISVAACGPLKMMETVSNQCRQFALPVQVSLEERMGCGVGACLGCVCTLRDENGGIRRAKVCKDGPVFQGEEVVWDAGI